MYKSVYAHVAATSFFAGEVEIFDFVTERVKRCIAAKRGRGGGSLKTHNDGWNWNLIKYLGSILYEHSVVVGNIYCTNIKMGGGTHRTRRYGCGCVGIQFIKIRTAYRRIQIYDLLFHVCVYSMYSFSQEIFPLLKV